MSRIDQPFLATAGTKLTARSSQLAYQAHLLTYVHNLQLRVFIPTHIRAYLPYLPTNLYLDVIVIQDSMPTYLGSQVPNLHRYVGK